MISDIKRTFKDSIFKDLFGKYDRRYLLELYRTLHPEDTTTEATDLQILSIETAFVDGVYNDLGFIAGDVFIILLEAQSTWSVNIIVRLFIYLGETYKKYLYIDKKREGKILSSTKYEGLPKPEVYVVYTGEDKDSIESELSFKKEFFPDEDVCLDLKAQVILADENKRDIINQYISFCKVVKRQNEDLRNKYGYHSITDKEEKENLNKEILKEAIQNAIDICIDKDILRDYLNDSKKEVSDMLYNIIPQEEAFEIALLNKKEEGKVEERENALKALVRMAKRISNTFEDVYNSIIENPEYSNCTREQVMKYY